MRSKYQEQFIFKSFYTGGWRAALSSNCRTKNRDANSLNANNYYNISKNDADSQLTFKTQFKINY